MKKILITGSNGFIGQELLSLLVKDKLVHVIALSRGQNRHPVREGYTYVDADVCDKTLMNEVIMYHRPDSVIHTVAMAEVEACEKDPDACEKINVDPVKVLVSLAEEYRFHLVYFSTDFVFDGQEGPYLETDMPKPVNVYGQSKLQAERVLQLSNIKWSIIRTILVYGIPYDKNRSNIVLWMKNSLAAGKEIKVVTDQYRMPTLVGDLAIACQQIIEREALGIFHISGEEMLNIYDIALKVCDCWAFNKSLVKPVLASSFPSSVARPRTTGFILDRAKMILDFSPHTLQEGLMAMKQQMND